MTEAELIASHLRAKGVTRCASAMPAHLPRAGDARTPDQVEREPAGTRLLARLEERFNELLDRRPDAPRQSADWWAAYPIGAVDPWRLIAEAAACFVIARDEGRESYRLFSKELCRAR